MIGTIFEYKWNKYDGTRWLQLTMNLLYYIKKYYFDDLEDDINNEENILIENSLNFEEILEVLDRNMKNWKNKSEISKSWLK